MSSFPPVTGFGDAKFRVMRGGRGELPDWAIRLNRVTDRIPGSNRSVTQILGVEPAVLTLPVEFDDRDHYRRCLALLGKTDTLTLLAGFTSAEGDREYLHGREYEHFANTLLDEVDRQAFMVDGSINATLVFRRGFDPMTGGEVL